VSKKEFSLGGIVMGVNPETRRLVISDTKLMNDFGRAVGYQTGDEVISINKFPLTVDNAAEFKSAWINSVKEGDVFKVKAERVMPDGKPKKVTLKTKVFKAELSEYNVLRYMENPSTQQLKIREAWLNP
jgi:hypothetical protein